MTDYIQTGSTTSSYTLNGNDSLIIDGTLTTTDTSAITTTGFNNVIYVAGSVRAFSALAIESEGSQTRITIAETGSVIGLDNFSNGALYLRQDGTGSFVANHGLISGNNGFVMNGTADDNDLVNTGTIVGTESNGIAIYTSGATIDNQGAVIGRAAGIFLQDGAHNLINSGTVTGEIGVVMNAFAGVDFFNTGMVTGTGGSAIELLYGATIRNHGQIIGDILEDDFGDDVTVIHNRGLIDGKVSLQGGNDRYWGARDGVVTEKVLGQAGNDILRGGRDDDVFDGGSNNDTLRGRRGDDNLTGGKGIDLIIGGRDDDTMTGNGGADIFVFKGETNFDTITDFQDNIDALDLSAFDVTSRAQLLNKDAIKGDGSGGSVINLNKIGGDGKIAIDDMAVNDWTNADFIF